MDNINLKLKNALKEKHMTQGDLCNKLGITQNGLRKMIDNNSMKIETLEQICKILELPMSYFLDIDIQNRPDSFWKRMVTDMNDEIANWRLRAYKAEELLKQNGINFHSVSKCGGVLAA